VLSRWRPASASSTLWRDTSRVWQSDEQENKHPLMISCEARGHLELDGCGQCATQRKPMHEHWHAPSAVGMTCSAQNSACGASGSVASHTPGTPHRKHCPWYPPCLPIPEQPAGPCWSHP
jgi:hypothetical protein